MHRQGLQVASATRSRAGRQSRSSTASSGDRTADEMPGALIDGFGEQPLRLPDYAIGVAVPRIGASGNGPLRVAPEPFPQDRIPDKSPDHSAERAGCFGGKEQRVLLVRENLLQIRLARRDDR